MRVPWRLLYLPLLVLALAAGVLTACGADSASSSADGDKARSPFAGSWEPVDAWFDIQWDAAGRSYSVVAGGSGGGLEVAEDGTGLAVTLVGKSGVRSDALPATAEGETLSFAIPISEETPTDVTLVSTGEGTASLTFVGQDNVWDFRKTDEITLTD